MILNEGQIISGRYEIIEKIGSGGMSIVYRAKDTKLDRDVTFKVLREEYVSTEEFKTRLKEEAKAVARLNHPNIVNIYDVGQEDTTNYIVMEYIDGQTLKEIIKRRAPFENMETIGVIMQIASALSHAHANKIVHRDIKPQNVLITTTGTVKVTDFGIARTTTSTNTVTLGGVTMGSVHYLSPEQARGGYVEAKSDLYSLGIVMFEVATGTLPFDGEKSVTVALKHINDPLPDMKAINPNISSALESIIDKLTQKQSSSRYRDADELMVDLREAINNPDVAVAERSEVLGKSPTKEISRDELTSIRKRAAAEREKRETSRDKDRDRDREKEREFISDIDVNSDYDELDMEDVDIAVDSGDFGRAAPSDWKMIVAGIVTALAIIIVIVVLALPRIRPLFEPGTEEPTATVAMVRVPNIVGKDFDIAELECEAMGLKLEKTGTVTSDTIPVNQITYQSYKADGYIYEGDTIGVEVCVGSDKYEIPNFVGDIVDNVYASQYDYPFSISVKEEYNNYVQRGYVIRQEPKGGELMPAGTPLTIYSSLGAKQEKSVVPDLRGKTQEEAAAMLEEVGLQLGTVAQQKSDDYPVGQVIAQAIAHGTEVIRGETIVGIVLSLGKGDSSQIITPSPSASPSSSPSSSAPPESTQSVTATPRPTPTHTPTQRPTATPTTTPTSTPPHDSTEEPTVRPIEIPTTPPDDETGAPSNVHEAVAKTMTVNHVFDPSFDGVEFVSVRIVKNAGDASIEVYSAEHAVAGFPFSLTFVDTGTVSYDIFINGIWSDTVTIAYTE